MNKKSNIYIILTYLFFIYPPFIWGLVLIYQDHNTGHEHIPSLYINLILIVVLALLCGTLIYFKKIHTPSTLEQKHLLFGLIGNIVVYFYTFQNVMKIDDYVTIYLILLLVLGVHTLLISKKLQAKELWILMSVFLVLDLAHMIGTGCGFTDGYMCFQSANRVFMYIIYSIMILTSLSYYSYSIYKLKQWDILKYLNMISILILSIVFQIPDMIEEKFAMTILISLPFFTILDFIITIVNKRYTHNMLFHYLRAYSILIIFVIMGEMDFFYGEASYEILAIMVTIAYISLFMTVFKTILRVEHSNKTQKIKGVLYKPFTEELIVQLKEVFGEAKSSFISLEDTVYSLAAIKENRLIGFVSTRLESLPKPLEDTFEVNIKIIEVLEEFQHQNIATTLLEKTEKYYKNTRAAQIRGASSKQNIAYINLFQKRGYASSPSLIRTNEDHHIEGFHFLKKL